MAAYSKRAFVTLRPEWEPELNQLKKEQFNNKPQSEMFRYLISLGLEAMNQGKDVKEAACNKVT